MSQTTFDAGVFFHENPLYPKITICEEVCIRHTEMFSSDKMSSLAVTGM